MLHQWCGFNSKFHMFIIGISERNCILCINLESYHLSARKVSRFLFCFDFLRFSVGYHVICKQRQFDFLFFSLYALFPFLVLLYQLELEYGNTVVWGDILALFLTGARNFQLMMSTVSFTYSLSIWGTCSQNVAQTVLKFVILQTQTPKCWILTV